MGYTHISVKIHSFIHSRAALKPSREGTASHIMLTKCQERVLRVGETSYITAKKTEIKMVYVNFHSVMYFFHDAYGLNDTAAGR
jgi:hypothetical protein